MLIIRDDVVPFITASEQDLEATKGILDLFGAATGLHTNIQECQIVPICCTEEELQRTSSILPGQVTEFPITYLGIPLTTGRLRKADIELVIRKVQRRLPTWKAGLLQKPGRLSLVKSTLTAIPINTIISIKLSAWATEAITKCMRGFFWIGTAIAQGGQCMMAWSRVARPTQFGGLGITDLEIARCALQLRWLWLKRTGTRRTWHAFPIECDTNVTAMFYASIQVRIGDGTRSFFWTDPWLEGTSIQLIAPELCKAVMKRAQNARTVAQALTGRQWIKDITMPLSIEAIIQYMELWIRLQHIQLLPTEDTISWRWTDSQQYTAKSVYTMFFAGSTQMDGANLI